MEDIFRILDVKHIDLLKMDIKREECVIINSINDFTLNRISQISIEFHYHCINDFTFNDILQCIKTMHNCGFKKCTIDKFNFVW